MIVYTGKNCGFCFGVKRAIDTVGSLDGDKTCIIGDLIHNESVIENLKSKGFTTVKSVDEILPNRFQNVVIRTHGETKETFEKLAKLGVNVIDCTCPFVKDIQKIVEKNFLLGKKIVIIGDKNHPEIIGINGWCNNSAEIIDSFEEFKALKENNYCIVVQTTYSENKFNKIIKQIQDSDIKTVDIFKTICYTTTKRQIEAENISKMCDTVLVLGGANSNNTEKLYNICKQNCKNTIKVSNLKDFDYTKIKNNKKVGIVFGASTPIEQFQEVIQGMEKSTEEMITKTTVEGEVEKSEMEKAFDSIKKNKDFRVGQIVTAKISSASDEGLTLSINTKTDFPLPKTELLGDYNKDEYNSKIGQDIRVMVTAKNPLKFSEKAMEKVLKDEAEIAEIKDGKIFEAKITETNKGGLVGKYLGYDLFVPSSQIRIGFVSDLDKYIGKTLRLKAEKVEAKGPRRQIIASQRVIIEEEKKIRDAEKAEKEAEFFGAIQEGDVVLGTPVRFAAFGAFVDVSGFDCLAHISDLSWSGCKQCSDVLEIGKQYEFKILKIDTENKRVSVGYKQLQPKPWDNVLDKYKEGDTVKGTVVRIVKFGAFVEIEKGIDGLVHVSQISNEWLENPLTALTVGQEIEAKIIAINPEQEKMTLSIKALLPEVEKPADEKQAKGKKKAKEDADEDVELREWKDDQSSVSIADLLNK